MRLRVRRWLSLTQLSLDWPQALHPVCTFMLRKHLAGHGVTIEARHLPSHRGPPLAFCTIWPQAGRWPTKLAEEESDSVHHRGSSTQTFRKVEVVAATVPTRRPLFSLCFSKSAWDSRTLESYHSLTSCLPLPLCFSPIYPSLKVFCALWNLSRPS